MALRRILTSVSAACGQTNGIRPFMSCPTRWFSVTGVGNLQEKEAGEERLFFNKEDEKLLKKLLTKITSQADKVDKHAAAGSKAAEISALNEIVGKHKLSDVEIAALLEWKKHSY